MRRVSEKKEDKTGFPRRESAKYAIQFPESSHRKKIQAATIPDRRQNTKKSPSALVEKSG
jgi:hypothetical protein